MKQYCEYCANAHWYDDFVYCDILKRLKTEQSAQRPNKCKTFELNPMSVFDANKFYNPIENRKQKVNDGEQIKLGE